MWVTARLSVMFVLITTFSHTQSFREVKDMNWTTDPSSAWPSQVKDHYEHRNVILLLNIANYSDNGLEWVFIASGVLLDNSRILTSYNPFRELIGFSNITDNIVALLPTGMINITTPTLKIANVVCGRQIVYVPNNENFVWYDRRHSPLHDLMVIRMEEEIGIAFGSTYFFGDQNFHWKGELDENYNSLISFPAGPNDRIDTEVLIFSLGYTNKKEMQAHDVLHRTDYENDDAVLADCEEWLPRQWGFFICIRNIDNLPNLGSGATLFSKGKLFGIGSFAMFKNDTGILVFTDVRYYEELIMETCGDQEFPVPFPRSRFG